MDSNSEGDGSNRKNSDSPGGGSSSSKRKRQMKTPFQLEALEQAYNLETYPTEASRLELSEKLGLTDRQLQMWFCHRRLKDKKEKGNPSKKLKSGLGGSVGSGSGSDISPDDEYIMKPRDSILSSKYNDENDEDDDEEDEEEDDMVVERSRRHKASQLILESRAISAVEVQLGEDLREDGPVLGLEFDSLPPNAFAEKDEANAEQHIRSECLYGRNLPESSGVRSIKAGEASYDDQHYCQEQSRARSDVYGEPSASRFHTVPLNGPSSSALMQGHLKKVFPLTQKDKHKQLSLSPPRDYDLFTRRDGLMDSGKGAQFGCHAILRSESPHALLDSKIVDNSAILTMERKYKSEDSNIATHVDDHEKLIQKEKLDMLRRKKEEQMRKEMERQHRERKKEEDRLMCEKQREEEKFLREQRRESERREKFLQRESLKAEKMRQKEEIRKEKEAVRVKAALEKANARRIVRESMELIEDERLELMELAVTNKGFTSITSLDYDTLQNLDTFRESLIKFPPENIQLKGPFGVQPWVSSEANVGNLLMVWKFLITFADVLELWPFTLDEFVQALHDYNSRLLGEIHISILSLIVKDIQDVGRTTFGSGTNQTAVVPEGGNPHIVEGAYGWGFDILNWQRHLSSLTWPEILRQFALSAGLGPKLKGRTSKMEYLDDCNEVNGSEDVVLTLRDGSAAQSAAAKIRERGSSASRKPRPQMTPGTVKYAAYHVLSLEGAGGLTILQLADKIQQSGLRDLTTSKTPEASISAALTRDVTLFERVAPSTYCVRPAFRKDPADAEAVLAAAREKLRIFQNGFTAGQNPDGSERDEEFERDGSMGQIEEASTPSSTPKTTINCSGNVEENLCSNGFGNDKDNDYVNELSNGIDARVTQNDLELQDPEHVSSEIDESAIGESWVQGLAEGEYSDLSVEERLSALVALTTIANEGNTVRAVLEGRLDTAIALKKQMLTDPPLDRRFLKEENPSKSNYPSAVDHRVESKLGSSVSVEYQNPVPVVYTNETSLCNMEDQKPSFVSDNAKKSINLPIMNTVTNNSFVDPVNIASEQHKFAVERSRAQFKSYIAHRAEEIYTYKSMPLGQDRRFNRYWQFNTPASSDPGRGRIFVECEGFWKLIDTEEAFDALLMSLDTRGIRESNLHFMLKKVERSFKENVQSKLQSFALGHYSKMAEDSSPDHARSMDSPNGTVCDVTSNPENALSFRIELGRNEMERHSALKRYKDLETWMWKECMDSSTVFTGKDAKKRCEPLLTGCSSCLNTYITEENCCHHCQRTFDVSDKLCRGEPDGDSIGERTPNPINFAPSCSAIGVKLLKALLALNEVYISMDALQDFWTDSNRRTWGIKLQNSSSVGGLLKMLTVLECAIRHDFVLSEFGRTPELMGSCTLPELGLDYLSSPESAPVLPWIPQTSAAVALRLLELGASVLNVKPQKKEPCAKKETCDLKELAPVGVSASVNSNREVKLTDLNDNQQRINNSGGSSSKRSTTRYLQGNRECKRGLVLGVSQGNIPGSKSKSRSTSAAMQIVKKEKPKQEQWAHREISGWGRRIVRGKRAERQASKEIPADDDMVRPLINLKSLISTVKPNPSYEAIGVLEGHNHELNSPETMETGDDPQSTEYRQERWNSSAHGDHATNGRLVYSSESSDEEDDDSNEEANGDFKRKTDSNGISERLNEMLGSSVSAFSDSESE